MIQVLNSKRYSIGERFKQNGKSVFSVSLVGEFLECDFHMQNHELEIQTGILASQNAFAIIMILIISSTSNV